MVLFFLEMVRLGSESAGLIFFLPFPLLIRVHVKKSYDMYSNDSWTRAVLHPTTTHEALLSDEFVLPEWWVAKTAGISFLLLFEDKKEIPTNSSYRSVVHLL